MHHIDVAYFHRCRTFRDLCVCVMSKQVDCAKTDEPIASRFGRADSFGPNDI